ncbi:MAG: TetR family transcriptional regulator [Clostridia bacterium]|nr:TetR family transcriptional regulator [Clostridia bacterium]
MTSHGRFTREMILEGAFRLFRREGMGGMNLRAIARETGCSTQPLFTYFVNAAEIRGEMGELATRFLRDTIEPALSTTSAMEEACFAFVRFAREDRALFFYLFTETRLGREVLLGEDGLRAATVAAVREQEDLDEAGAQELTQAAAIYAHGLAFMLASGTTEMTDEEVKEKIEAQFRAVRERLG